MRTLLRPLYLTLMASTVKHYLTIFLLFFPHWEIPVFPFSGIIRSCSRQLNNSLISLPSLAALLSTTRVPNTASCTRIVVSLDHDYFTTSRLF